MPPTVVILSCPQDVHAHAMCEALERKGAQPWLFCTPDFPQKASLTIKPSAGGALLACHTEEETVELGAHCHSVWVRRPFFAKTPEDFEASDRLVIEHECREMRASFFALLCPQAFWVNPPSSAGAEHKPTQLIAAQRCGFRVPPTLVSNDPQEILSFVQDAGRPVIYKPFHAFVPTSLLTKDLLEDPDTLRWTPGIYQHYVEKDHEIRVTVIGRRLFAVRIHSQQTLRGKVDWREALWAPPGQGSDLSFEPTTLPRSVQRACRELMTSLGLAFGAIDLLVTPAQEYVFLEVNPEGQFLWAEYEAGLPLLDAMAEMLIQGRLDYVWTRRTQRVKFDSDLLAVAEERRRLCMRKHVCDLRTW